jgi:CHAD domain-containing protein
MHRVLEECTRASVDFAPDPVHDLRVALRRCRSMADGLMAIDPDPGWKQMKKAGKRVFGRLGELRDMQVMEEWVHRLGTADDAVTIALLTYLHGREAELKREAGQALQEFDQKQWKKWAVTLPRRAARVRPGSLVFKHLALERWTDAYELHRRALRNRSQTAFHSLRIGIKRFRYIVENFLPEQHAAWKDELKELQDMLGEVHDLDVLRATALQVHAFFDAEDRSRWHAKIVAERTSRIEKYTRRMIGKSSLWHLWRAALPQGEQIESAAWSRIKLVGSFQDPHFRHSMHVARLALQMYGGLPAKTDPEIKHERTLLQIAALLHDVGRATKDRPHHKASYRLISGLKPPLGWTDDVMHMAASIARYHAGALPRAGQKALAGYSAEERKRILKLAGILRLANAFDADRSGHIRRVKLELKGGMFVVSAEGYSSRDRLAEEIAAARHLLETVLRRPILVKALRAARKKSAAQLSRDTSATAA